MTINHHIISLLASERSADLRRDAAARRRAKRRRRRTAASRPAWPVPAQSRPQETTPVMAEDR